MEARTALYHRLTEVLGPEYALTLMTYLPIDEPATKADLDRMKRSVDHGFELIDQRFAGIDQRFTVIDQRFAGIDQRLDRIGDRLNGFDVRFDNLHEAMRQQTRGFIFATMGTMVSLAGISFAAAALI